MPDSRDFFVPVDGDLQPFSERPGRLETQAIPRPADVGHGVADVTLPCLFKAGLDRALRDRLQLPDQIEKAVAAIAGNVEHLAPDPRDRCGKQIRMHHIAHEGKIP